MKISAIVQCHSVYTYRACELLLKLNVQMLNSAMFRNFQEGNCFEGRQIGMSGYMGVGSYEILVKMRRHD